MLLTLGPICLIIESSQECFGYSVSVLGRGCFWCPLTKTPCMYFQFVMLKHWNACSSRPPWMADHPSYFYFCPLLVHYMYTSIENIMIFCQLRKTGGLLLIIRCKDVAAKPRKLPVCNEEHDICNVWAWICTVSIITVHTWEIQVSLPYPVLCSIRNGFVIHVENSPFFLIQA